ncbi:hypothetical protein EJV47_20845 [Hymenobacter gummosus]|uniref:Uncharacterized protein n=1 Tax=Hymenobacter gummosus TaxID=1776032 RepID=A0A431TXV3_9BACT|nr:hypothetical protein [Hymenobacter gummosus]RTQ46822.1 hypothetical protein EJV47_20845 [Hymenobacter gummosus]
MDESTAYELTFALPMLGGRRVSLQLLTGARWRDGLRTAAPTGQQLTDEDYRLTLYATPDGRCYGEVAHYEPVDLETDWDEGLNEEWHWVTADTSGYLFRTVEEAQAAWHHVRIRWHRDTAPLGYVRLTPAERTALLHGQTTTRLPEQYASHDGWESVQLPDGRVLLTNPHRRDKAHASLYNDHADYLRDKQDYEDFLAYVDQLDG